MGSPHKSVFDLGGAYQIGANKIKDPGASGTFDLEGRGVFHAVVTATGNYTLPNSPAGTRGYITTDDTSTVTVKDVAGNTITSFTGTSGASGVEVYATDANSWTVVGSPDAGDLGIADAGSYTSTTTVETALQQLMKESYILRIPISTFVAANGTPLTVFANNAASNPGPTLADSEAYGIRWNDNATQVAVLSSVLLPQTAMAAATLHILASKTGATTADATTFTVVAYGNATGALHDAGGNLGGTTTAMTGNATAKTVQHVTLAMTLASPTPPANLTISIAPTTNLLNTDDVIVEAVWLSFAP